ncbi:MAG: Aminodeoxychorismate lyase [Candidatus Saccharibacteria bacterium]|nr:Aminodeoxychorismate lyase [Candidatus Saccharibacteria bacterium]
MLRQLLRAPEPEKKLEAPEPVDLLNATNPAPRRRPSKLTLIMTIILCTIGIGSLVAAVIWYKTQLSPAQKGSQQLISVTVDKGMTPSRIAQRLAEKKIIRSAAAFDWYTRISGTRDKLQAGSYRLSPSDSTPTIVKHLMNGNIDEFNITFLPGGTLEEHRQVLVKAGYSEAEVDAGLAAQYDSPALATKPAGADLEGYIYGETYRFSSGASVQDIISRTLDELSSVIQTNNLVAQYEAQGLTLYEGITLASIIQREVPSAGDQKQVAQVFFKRLNNGTVLGSDVTYQYIADKLGIARDVNLDSPYNTRRYPGLPPGPISSPGLGALLAVGAPAGGDYVYFLSGDDDVTYFARTLEEHEQNIHQHCQIKCSTL